MLSGFISLSSTTLCTLFVNFFSYDDSILASYLGYSTGDYSSLHNLTVLHVAAKYGAAKAAKALLEFIVAEKVKPNRYLDEDGGGIAIGNPMKGKETFLTQLFQGIIDSCLCSLGREIQGRHDSV